MPRKVTVAAREPSFVTVVSIEAGGPSTRNTPVPPSGSAAVTRSRSARSAWTTGAFTPSSLPSANVTDAAVDQRVPGSIHARIGRVSPPAIASRYCFFCSSVPKRSISPPASTIDSTNGSGAMTLPSSSAARLVSTAVASNGRLSTPISASLSHAAKPGSVLVISRRVSDES